MTGCEKHATRHGSIRRRRQTRTLLHVSNIPDILLPFRPAKVAHELGADTIDPGAWGVPHTHAAFAITANDRLAVRPERYPCYPYNAI